MPLLCHELSSSVRNHCRGGVGPTPPDEAGRLPGKPAGSIGLRAGSYCARLQIWLNGELRPAAGWQQQIANLPAIIGNPTGLRLTKDLCAAGFVKTASRAPGKAFFGDPLLTHHPPEADMGAISERKSLLINMFWKHGARTLFRIHSRNLPVIGSCHPRRNRNPPVPADLQSADDYRHWIANPCEQKVPDCKSATTKSVWRCVWRMKPCGSTGNSCLYCSVAT